MTGLPPDLAAVLADEALGDSEAHLYDWSFSPCTRPVKMRRHQVHTTTGEVFLRDFDVRCGTRRQEDCEPCSKVWQADAFHALVRGANQYGGTLTFITFTAPGDSEFGRTHTAQHLGLASERCACRNFHSPDSPLVGLPVDPETYDYDRVSEFNNAAPRLTTVTMQKVWRQWATELGISVKEARKPTVRVMEFQRRGLLHVHLLVLGEVPRALVERAVKGSPKEGTRRSITPASHRGFHWGTQVDVQHIKPSDRGHLLAYVTKMVSYAIKDVTAHDPMGKAIKPAYQHRYALEDAGERAVSCDHSRASCKHGWATQTINLGDRKMGIHIGCKTSRVCVRHGRASRQFGFTGNVLAMNRSWGTTLGDARRTRREWQAAQQATPAVASPMETIRWERVTTRPAQAGRLDLVMELVTHLPEMPPKAAAPEPAEPVKGAPCHPSPSADRGRCAGEPEPSQGDDRCEYQLMLPE
jgi:hypothetical protein